MCDKDLPPPSDPIANLSLLSELMSDPTLMGWLTARVQDYSVLNWGWQAQMFIRALYRLGFLLISKQNIIDISHVIYGFLTVMWDICIIIVWLPCVANMS